MAERTVSELLHSAVPRFANKPATSLAGLDEPVWCDGCGKVGDCGEDAVVPPDWVLLSDAGAGKNEGKAYTCSYGCLVKIVGVMAPERKLGESKQLTFIAAE